jgi:hypothetical protein
MVRKIGRVLSWIRPSSEERCSTLKKAASLDTHYLDCWVTRLAQLQKNQLDYVVGTSKFRPKDGLGNHFGAGFVVAVATGRRTGSTFVTGFAVVEAVVFTLASVADIFF